MAIAKELKVRYSKRMPNLYEVYYEGGGELPAQLANHYTSPGDANKAIKAYKESKVKAK